MITEHPDFDLSLLQDNFVVCGDYTKEVILDELEYWRKNTDFLILTSDNNGSIDGFLIAYRNRNSLWISQVWRKAGTDIKSSREAFEKAKEWAIERNMTSITGETKRTEIKAMERYGFKEYSLNMRCEI